jgi:dephospho-CoA kinase
MRLIFQLVSTWILALVPISNGFTSIRAEHFIFHHHHHSSVKRRNHSFPLYCKLINEKTPSSMTNRESFPSLSIVGVCGSIGSGKSFACSLLTSKLNDLGLASSEQTLSTSEIPVIAAHHVDTDSLAHGVYEPGSKAITEIGEEFGQHVIADGTVDRKALGAIAFGDKSKMAVSTVINIFQTGGSRFDSCCTLASNFMHYAIIFQKLERIVWPHVKDLLLQRIKGIEESTKGEVNNGRSHTVVIVEAAVLLDANWDDNDLFDAIWVVRASSDTSCERLVQNRGMKKEEALNRLQAQLDRRGIGNWKEELESGAVTAVIENEGSAAAELWNKVKQCLVDPKCWKDDRCPPELGI